MAHGRHASCAVPVQDVGVEAGSLLSRVCCCVSSCGMVMWPVQDVGVEAGVSSLLSRVCCCVSLYGMVMW